MSSSASPADLVVAFLPFSTRLLSEYIHERHAEKVAATLYGITLLLVSTLVSVLWRYAVRSGLVRPDSADEEVQTMTRHLTPGLAGYVVLMSSGSSCRSSPCSDTWSSPCISSCRSRSSSGHSRGAESSGRDALAPAHSAGCAGSR